MKKTTILRSLRIKNDISLRELADAVDVSLQYISAIELGNVHWSNSNALIQRAFETVICKKTKRLDDLKKSYLDNKDRLLEFEMMEENQYGL